MGKSSGEMDLVLQMCALKPMGPLAMGVAVPSLYVVGYYLNTMLLIDWSRTTLLPYLTTLSGGALSSPDQMAWACVLAGLGLIWGTFEFSLIYSTLHEKAGKGLAGAGEGYAGSEPRNQMTRQTGLGYRLFAAHQNALEDMPAFGLAVTAAFFLKADMEYTAAVCALCYICGLETIVLIFANAIFFPKIMGQTI